MEQNLPQEVNRSKIRLAPELEIEVIWLDDGTRVVSDESMMDFLKWLSKNPEVR